MNIFKLLNMLSFRKYAMTILMLKTFYNLLPVNIQNIFFKATQSGKKSFKNENYFSLLYRCMSIICEHVHRLELWKFIKFWVAVAM